MNSTTLGEFKVLPVVLDDLPEWNELIEIFNTLDIAQEVTQEMSLEEFCKQATLSHQSYREKLHNNPPLDQRISALLDKIGSYVEKANAPHK